MRLVTATLLILVISAGSLAQNKRIGTFQFVEKKGNHTVRIIFRTRPFNRSKHRIASREGLVSKIDGRTPLGTDGNLPRIEIESIKLFIDGKEVPVPKRLYSDCYEPRFDLNESFALKFGDSPDSVFVFMNGADAAGSYQVLWAFRKDGRHSRFSGACSDCGFLDFRSGFFN